DRRGRASVIGYVVHFANGFVFALCYYAVFRAVGHAGWLFGALLGLVHAAVGRGGHAPARVARVSAHELRQPHGDLHGSRPYRVRRDRRRLHRAPPLREELGVLDLEPEAGQPLDDRAVEGVLVVVRRGLVERRGEVVPKVGEDLGARLDELLVVAETLLGLLPAGAVV